MLGRLKMGFMVFTVSTAKLKPTRNKEIRNSESIVNYNTNKEAVDKFDMQMLFNK